MNLLSLLLPFGYLGVLVLSLATFSHLYRRRKALAATRLKPWFPPHLTRQIYLTLLEQASTASSSAKGASNTASPTKIPDSVLRAALLRRATTDIHRLIQIRNAKPAIGQLLQRGAVGDELWQRFQIAEKEMEAELREVVGEANALGLNWGQTIFQNAGECAHAEHLRGKLAEIEAERVGEKEDWERKRAVMRGEFLKEIEGGDEDVEDSVIPATSSDTKSARAEKKPGSSDEEAVIVEGGGPAAASAGMEKGRTSGGELSAGFPGGGGGGGSSKKKKGKK